MKILKKSLLILLLTALHSAIFAQQIYLISVETHVGGKLEDKFAFQMTSGDSQKKGFEARLLAKRYRMPGFRNVPLDYKRAEEKDVKETEVPQKTQFQIASEMLEKLVSEINKLQSDLDSGHANLEVKIEQRDLLEKIIKAYKSNSSKMKEALEKYRSKYRIEEENPELERLFRKRPSAGNDYERIELGSYCEMKFASMHAKTLNLELVYAYNRILTWIYVDKTNNGNTIGKLPIIEGFEKDAKISVSIDAPFCIQFARGNTGDAKSLREALEGSSLFNMGGNAGGYSLATQDNSELNAMGPLSEIQEKFGDSLGSATRVIIKVSLVK